MGRDKALLSWPPVGDPGASSGTFLSAAIELFSPFVDIVFVVGGKNAENLAPVVYARGASLVVNPDPERGQFSSLQSGLREVLNHGRDAALITLVDRPPVTSETIATLDEAFEQAQIGGKWAVIPEYQGKHGHPFFAGRELIEAFLRAPVTSSARDVEHAHVDKIVYVPLNDPQIVTNVDTPEQYAALPPQMLNSK
jgi:molybdenum cofactor cytidylyltransferase